MDRPTKIMEKLAIDTLAIFETYVVPVSKEGLAREIPKSITVDIEENIVPSAAAGTDSVVSGAPLRHH